MNKNDIRVVVNELRKGTHYPGVEDTPLYGIGLSDFETGKFVRKEAIVNFLNWQCGRFDGTLDEEELTNCVSLFKEKHIIMV
jgi:hypothetical protein